MVRMVRFELTRVVTHYPLKIARLPVPPHPQAQRILSFMDGCVKGIVTNKCSDVGYNIFSSIDV